MSPFHGGFPDLQAPHGEDHNRKSQEAGLLHADGGFWGNLGGLWGTPGERRGRMASFWSVLSRGALATMNNPCWLAMMKCQVSVM